MSWIYIIGVIIFAIVSNVNKAQKGKEKQRPAPGSMPTFGGGGAREQKEQRSGFPPQGEERQYDVSTSDPDFGHYPGPNYETGEGVSQMHPDEEQVGDRAERMHKELEQMYSAFERISEEDNNNRSTESSVRSKETSSGRFTGVGVHPKQLQNGLIWAEILSPPHSKRTYNSRRRF